MVVAYDGTDFSGFAPQRGQPHVRTVGGVLGEAVAKVVRHDVELTCAGRTDAGVHAWGQVVSFPAPTALDPRKLASAVTSMLAPEVVVREVRRGRGRVRRAPRRDLAALPGTRS
ncbi:MAG: hypothetical protein KatS3mg010_1281 [Acidimicrobiia bacterium]|nr:MAG: hypothetical protein KatS3mg010_1281 [Acidimicrobiia bacterium]